MKNVPTTSWRSALQSMLPRSLRMRLLVFLLAAIVLAGAVQGALAYRGALDEADALFDYHMQQTALALRSGLPVDAQGLGPGLDPEDENHEFIVQVWTNEGLRIFESAVGAALPQIAVLGFANVQARGGTYRVFSMQTRSQVIQVAQNMAARRDMARSLALRTLAPLAIMAPLLVLAVWWGVSRSLAPVERVRRQLAPRQADDLSPVSDAQLPDEVQPLVSELNLLFERVQRAFDAQEHFVADAAHELRSPLAALRLQLQGLQRAGDDAARAVAIERLSAGIDRATREPQRGNGRDPRRCQFAQVRLVAVPLDHGKRIDEIGQCTGPACPVQEFLQTGEVVPGRSHDDEAIRRPRLCAVPRHKRSRNATSGKCGHQQVALGIGLGH